MYKITGNVSSKTEESKFLKFYLEQIEKRGLPAFKVKDQLYIFGVGEKLKTMKAFDSLRGAIFSKDKNQTSYLLAGCGVSVPKQVLIKKPDQSKYKQLIKGLKYPLVAKPADLSLSIGVTLDIKDEAQLKQALKYAFKESQIVVVEEFVKDAYDHRLTFFYGKFLGALISVPQFIKGDGRKTVEQLVGELNSWRKKKYALKPRTSEWICHTALIRHNLTYKSVLPKDKEVKIYSGSGLYKNVSEKIHPENIELCRLATQTLGLNFSGVDFMSPDASIPYYENGGKINEINSFPDISIYQKTPIGKKVNLADKIVRLMFPTDKSAWIPIKYKGKIITEFSELKKLLNVKPREVFLSDPDRKIKNKKLPLIAFLVNFKTKKINI